MGRLNKLLGLGARVAGDTIIGAITLREELQTRIKQAKTIADGLAELKGASMKLGQMLSIQGGHLLPPEVTEILSKLQNSAPALSGPEIEKIVRAQLQDKMSLVEKIEPIAVGAASIGQVHRAKLKSGDTVAMKIQYPGVAEAIDSEMDLLQKILQPISKIYIGKLEADELVAEVKKLLKQEVDYLKEAEYLRFFSDKLQSDPRFAVPKVYGDLTTSRLLTMSFENGIGLKTLSQMPLSQKSRNTIAEWIFELLILEIYKFRTVQTDPNFGNYLFQLEGGEISKIVLLDFGACKTYSEEFVKAYQAFGEHLIKSENKKALEIAFDLKFISSEESSEVHDLFIEMCAMTLVPLTDPQPFDYRNTALPKKIIEVGWKFVRSVRKTSPPTEVVFLNRKLGGFYNILQTLGANVDLWPVRERILGKVNI